MNVLLRGSCAALLTSTAIFAMAVRADAQEVALSVPITTVTRGEPGSVHVLGSRQSAELEGQTCDVVVEGDNNGSVHAGNDLILTSETGSVTLADFEREAGAVTRADQELTIGATLTLSLRLGDAVRSDGLATSSGGAVVSLVDCTTPPPPPETTTTTTPCTEDMPCWDCHTMGNMTCGTTPAPPTGTSTPPPVLPHTGADASTILAFVSGALLVSGLSSLLIARFLKGHVR